MLAVLAAICLRIVVADDMIAYPVDGTSGTEYLPLQRRIGIIG
jgi:hypothetical protein